MKERARRKAGERESEKYAVTARKWPENSDQTGPRGSPRGLIALNPPPI